MNILQFPAAVQLCYKHKLNEILQRKNTAICALKLESNSVNICVLTIYREPIREFNYLTHKVDDILHTNYTPTLDFITCGDIFIYSSIHTHTFHFTYWGTAPQYRMCHNL